MAFGDNNSRTAYDEIKDEYRAVKTDITYARERLTPELSAINSQAAPKFEYLVLEDIGEDELDARGANGWELVNFAPYTVGFGIGGNERLKVHMRFVFKRPMGVLPPHIEEELQNLRELSRRKAELAGAIQALGETPD